MYWHESNDTNGSFPVNRPWRIRYNALWESIRNTHIITIKNKKNKAQHCSVYIALDLYNNSCTGKFAMKCSSVVCYLKELVRSGVWSASAPGVGVTNPISSVPLFSEFFNNATTHVDYWISCLFLAGVAVAQVRWHLSNINVIQII